MFKKKKHADRLEEEEKAANAKHDEAEVNNRPVDQVG